MINHLKRFWNWFTSLWRRPLPTTPVSEVFTVDAPKPKQGVKVTGVMNRKRNVKTAFTRNGQRKHPLHKFHSGTFSPIKGI